MKKFLLFPCLGLALLQSCSIPTSQTSFFNNHLNWRSYYFPVDKLFEPKVYCYANASGVFNKYTLIQTTLEGQDTIVSYEHYDSTFSLKFREREQITKAGYNSLQYTLVEQGEEIPFEIKSGFVAWDQTLNSEKDNFKNVFSASMNGVNMEMHLDASIHRTPDNRLTDGYPVDASILLINVAETEVGGSNVKGQQIARTDTVCFSAGTGMVMEIGQEESHFLKKIITPAEFQQLKDSR